MNLNKNQKILIGALAIAVIAVFIFVYRNAAEESAPYGTNTPSQSAPKPVPQSVDGITSAIIDEAMGDQAALDQEAAGEDAQIQEETQAVNDLGNAYDENSY